MAPRAICLNPWFDTSERPRLLPAHAFWHAEHTSCTPTIPLFFTLCVHTAISPHQPLPTFIVQLLLLPNLDLFRQTRSYVCKAHGLLPPQAYHYAVVTPPHWNGAVPAGHSSETPFDSCFCRRKFCAVACAYSKRIRVCTLHPPKTERACVRRGPNRLPTGLIPLRVGVGYHKHTAHDITTLLACGPTHGSKQPHSSHRLQVLVHFGSVRLTVPLVYNFFAARRTARRAAPASAPLYRYVCYQFG